MGRIILRSNRPARPHAPDFSPHVRRPAATFTVAGNTVAAQQTARPATIPSVEDRIAGLRNIDGYFPLYWDDRAGTLYLEISRFDSDFLFSTGLSAGLGSNDIGLDRGGGGQRRVMRFHRVGPKVMLVQPNQSFRSSATNPRGEIGRGIVAQSILWGFTVAAESMAECSSMQRRSFATFMVQEDPRPDMARRRNAQRVLLPTRGISRRIPNRHDIDVRQ
jgi:hypothetical protein